MNDIIGIIQKGIVGSLSFIFRIVKGPNHPDTGNGFTHNAIDGVQPFLNGLGYRTRFSEDKIKSNHKNGHGNNGNCDE